MSGRIKLLDSSGTKLSEENTPKLPYKYDIIEPFDDGCGTYGLEQWQLPHPQCPEHFVCDVEDLPSSVLNEEAGGPDIMLSQQAFATCIDSMNCAMLNGMTTMYGGEELKNDGTADVVLFLRQMIPHHSNAVSFLLLLPCWCSLFILELSFLPLLILSCSFVLTLGQYGESFAQVQHSSLQRFQYRGRSRTCCWMSSGANRSRDNQHSESSDPDDAGHLAKHRGDRDR